MTKQPKNSAKAKIMYRMNARAAARIIQLSKSLILCPDKVADMTEPVAVLELTPEADAQRVEVAARALCSEDKMATWTHKNGYRPHKWTGSSENVKIHYRKRARAVLASLSLLSIPRNQPSSRKKI